ncbi:MAG: gliding motility-associated C-terminal domain-containing protein [Owenweeksia sp.]|nr:gliding motility-associated C-terminal domain-containing protein [Owenweeksia sp.]
MSPVLNDTIHYFLEVYDSPVAGMKLGAADPVRINSEKTFYYTGNGDSVRIEWWYNGVQISKRKAIQLQFDTEGEHEVLQIVKKGICTDTISQYVYVEDVFKIFIPNAFTPNDDGVNELFTFKGVGIKNFTARIYNRWQVFT